MTSRRQIAFLAADARRSNRPWHAWAACSRQARAAPIRRSYDVPARTEAEPQDGAHAGPGKFRAMKKILELLVCFLHPIAVVLIWIDLATRRDMAGGWKLAWAIFSLIPLVPFLYVLTGGDLW